MYFFKTGFALMLAALVMACSGCGDNLFPSDEDKRPTVQAGGSGGAVSQKAPDFAVPDSSGTTVTLASSLAGRKGAVFYFAVIRLVEFFVIFC